MTDAAKRYANMAAKDYWKDEAISLAVLNEALRERVEILTEQTRALRAQLEGLQPQ